jgi:hypothetical protein
MITLQIPESDRCDGCMFLDAGKDGKGNVVEGFAYKWASCMLFENLTLIGEFDAERNAIGYCKHAACRRVVGKGSKI